TPACRVSEGDAAAHDVRVHHPVADQRIEWITEGRRAIALEEEMPDPGEAVTGERHAEQPPRVPGDKRRDKKGQHQGRADEMQPPAGAVAVLVEVVRVEFAKGFEAFLHFFPSSDFCRTSNRTKIVLIHWDDLRQMLRLSKMTDYGAVALAYMASRPDAVHAAAEVAEATRINLPTVSKLLKQLTRSGLLVSQRGANGGYVFARRPEEITAGAIR